MPRPSIAVALALTLALPVAAAESQVEVVGGATPDPHGDYLYDPAIDGWEGFFPADSITDLWLEARGIPFGAEAVHGVLHRVGKLVMDDGEREAAAADLDLMEQRYCTEPEVRAWNEDRCKALEQRECDGDTCTYRHFGNCSGVVFDATTFLTAAHCVDGIVDHPKRRFTSVILLDDHHSEGPRRLPLGDIRVGKTDFDHHWVALDDDDPVDVASITSHISDTLKVIPLTPLPDAGAALFIAGYPRVEGRDPVRAAAHDYTLTFGTPSVSFGRLADPNPDDLPLCNVDGHQEHWALTADCPAGEVTLDDFSTYTGVITNSPILTTYDSCNGYSGAPVFDAFGRLVGINTTLMSDTNPQDRFVPHARMVAIPISRTLERLSDAPSTKPKPKRRTRPGGGKRR